MKKTLSLLLALLLILSAAAVAETSGDIAAECEDGTLYIAAGGLKKIAPDGSVTTVREGEVLYPQIMDGVLYYVVLEEREDEYGDEPVSAQLRALDLESGEDTLLLEDKCGCEYEYDEAYSHVTDYTTFNGFEDMTCRDGKIYFVGNDGTPGSYYTRVNPQVEWELMNAETAYQEGGAVKVFDPADGTVTTLIGGLGNGSVHMAVNGGAIAVMSCFVNSLFAYDFCNFMLLNLDGSEIYTLENHTESYHMNFYEDHSQFTVIADAIRTDGEKIYASLGDSEGDFASSRLFCMNDFAEGRYEPALLEAFYTFSVMTDDGSIICLASDADDVYYEDIMTVTLNLCVLKDGEVTRLAYIPEHSALSNNARLAAVNGYAYMCGGSEVMRVSLAGGMPETLTEHGFEADPAFDPANYDAVDRSRFDEDGWEIDPGFLLNDADTYIYSREELEIYDSDTLALMRNEILARHGYVFKKDKYIEYFGSQPWYAPDEKFDYNSMLNDAEKANVETIKAIEADRQ